MINVVSYFAECEYGDMYVSMDTPRKKRKYTHWTDQECELIRELFGLGKPYKVITEKLNAKFGNDRTLLDVQQKIKRMKLTRNKMKNGRH